MFVPVGDNVQQRSFPLMPCLLIGMNLLVYAYQMRLLVEHQGNPAAEAKFVESWGLVPQELAQGQVLGLLSHMFVHGGAMHLAGNMVVLWTFAGSLEVGLGSLCLLNFYLFWGLAAGMAHVAMNWHSQVPLIGASGAIAGLIGAYTVAFGAQANIRGFLFLGLRGIPVQIPAAVFGLVWIGFQLWDASADPQGLAGVAWYAHIGGFLAGALTMWLASDFLERKLVDGLDGEPTFVDRNPHRMDSIGKRDATDTPEPPQDPTVCPYCRASLEQATPLSSGLVRCGNPSCRRLAYAPQVSQS